MQKALEHVETMLCQLRVQRIPVTKSAKAWRREVRRARSSVLNEAFFKVSSHELQNTNLQAPAMIAPVA